MIWGVDESLGCTKCEGAEGVRMGWKRLTCISSSGELADNEHRASASAVASHDMSCSASAGRAAGVPISLSLVAGRE